MPYDDRQTALGRRGFAGLLGAAVVAGLTGCGSDGDIRPSVAETRSVQHPLGNAYIPVSPKRVVSLDASGGLQVSLEVGAPLIASETLGGAVGIPGYLPRPAAGFESLGFNQPNLEKIVKLAPDLIIGNLQRIKDLYPQLSAIAPTVPYENAGKGKSWQESVRGIADLLGQSGKQDAKLASFRERALQVKTEHKAFLTKRSVVLLHFTNNELRILRGPIFGSTILDEVRVRRSKSTTASGGTDTYYPIGREHVGVLADADVILYFVGGGAFDAAPDQIFKSYTNNALWTQLPAVKAGRVARLDPAAWWDGYSVSAANTCLQQLTTVLRKMPQK
ncbi:iron-siderophore ABC transporter substrate-binding protein [Kribbella antibiotica]|uniref:Iron-siderophore ABC transporter substrate-binding protein n=1 Tax=Kribbella antibiotica TaxID=190195 RepID=A0A4R4YVF7_9ACTN|nr:iron-siderophore ABC transporter substrate-binding protein [Kribbella antibiotica]TDD48309.1 iron-siderophore ABC transporter substrate-binding protein [Kribbella antibiotica]